MRSLALVSLLLLAPPVGAQLLAVSPCNVVDDRPEAREYVTGSFEECVAFLRTNRPYWREGVPKVALQHQQLMRGLLGLRDVAEARRLHRKAMDLFSTLVDTPVNSRAESELASAMIADYLLISQRLRQGMDPGHADFPRVEREAFAEPLAVLTRVMDRRSMLTTTLAQRFKDRMRKQATPAARVGNVLVPNKLDLPLRDDPVETLLAGLERRVEEYQDAGEDARAAKLVDTCRTRLGPPGKPKGRWWIRVERRLRQLAERLH